MRKIRNSISSAFRSLTRKLTAIWLWFVVSVVSTALLVSYHILRGGLTSSNWWNDVYFLTSTFLLGTIVSFIFYYLVVFVPERRRRNVIKGNLQKFYSELKYNILEQIIVASEKGGRTDLSPDSGTIEKLLAIDEFKKAYEGGREGNEGFYAFQNYIGQDVPEYQEIVFCFHILSKQIDFVLHNVSITDQRVFDFFKNLELYLTKVERIGPGYYEERFLSRFIWEIFAGFSIIDGYRGYDIIEKMIEDI